MGTITSGLTDEGASAIPEIPEMSSALLEKQDFVPMMGLIISGSKTSRVGGRGLLLPQAAPVWGRHTRGQAKPNKKSKRFLLMVGVPVEECSRLRKTCTK